MKYIFVIAISLICELSFSQEKNYSMSSSSEYSFQYALIEASRQKMIGNINEAINLYQSCINAKKDCDVAHYELGTVYSAIGENARAEENLAIAYNLQPKNYWYGIAYSELLAQNNKKDKSLKILKKTRKLNKINSLTIDFKMSEIYTEQRKFKKALSILEDMESKNGVSEMISFKKIEIYKIKKEYKNAEEVIGSLIKEAPEVIEYQIILAEFFSEIEDTISALKAYERAFIMDSTNVYAISNLADIYSSRGEEEKSYFYLNQAFLNKNIPIESKIQTMMLLNKDRDLIKRKRSYIEKMITGLSLEYPENIDVKSVAYDFYNGLEEHAIALGIITEILLSKKSDFIIWQQALYNASMLENYEELITIGEEALKFFPNKSELYLFVGMAYFEKEKFEEAYKVLSIGYPSIKAGDRIKIQFLLFLSEISYKTNRKKEAYAYFDQLIIEEPDNDLTKNNYSYYLALDSTDLLKAKQLSYSTLINSPENATFVDTYAWILFKLLDFVNAKHYAEKAMVINAETDADIIFHYAEILYAVKEFELAEKYYKLASDHGFSKETIDKKLLQFSETE